MKQPLFILVCTILDIFIQIKGTQRSFEVILQVFEEALREFQDNTWEEMVGFILDDFVRDSYPDPVNLQNSEGIERLAT